MTYWTRHAWRGFSTLVAILCVVTIGMIAFLLTRLPPVPATSGSAPGGGIEYKDLISIVLTALSAMIALLAFFIAAFAFWGFSYIEKKLIKVAKKAADKAAREVAEPVASRATAAYLVRSRQNEDGVLTSTGTDPEGDYGIAAGKDNGAG